MQNEETVFKMYIKESCPFCVKARDYIVNQLGTSLHTIDVTEQPSLRAAVIEETGHKTVPVVFLGNRFIGGCDDVLKFGKSSDGQLQILRREVNILRNAVDELRRTQ